jgi:hypothetical protein
LDPTGSHHKGFTVGELGQDFLAYIPLRHLQVFSRGAIVTHQVQEAIFLCNDLLKKLK